MRPQVFCGKFNSEQFLFEAILIDCKVKLFLKYSLSYSITFNLFTFSFLQVLAVHEYMIEVWYLSFCLFIEARCFCLDCCSEQFTNVAYLVVVLGIINFNRMMKFLFFQVPNRN